MAAKRRAPPYIFEEGQFQSPPSYSPPTYAYPLTEIPLNNHNIGVNPVYPHGTGVSLHHSSQLPPSWNENFLSQSPIIPPPHSGTYSTDSPPKQPMYAHQHSVDGLKGVAEPFPMFSSQPDYDKENVYSQDILPQNTSYSFPQKSITQKRKSSVAPLGDRGQKKQKKPSSQPQVEISSDPTTLPDPGNLPVIEDDGNKPSFSYSQLIAMAILRAPMRRLTLAQIYKWISESFSFYGRSADGGPGWQNSVRHNLSLNKAFMKVERPKDDPGKGHYWCIQSGSEGQFLKEKSKPANLNSNLSTVHARRSSISQSLPQPIMTKTVDSSKFPEEDELSSDATIPASDPAIHDGIAADDNMMPPPSKFLRSSPPPAIHSSPPQIPATVRERTPPAVPRFAMPTSRPNGSRKRKSSIAQGGLGDSGYYSSIESSAIRNSRPFLTSEMDSEHPVNKFGRAEEELARIRSSSYDSPLKTRPSILVSSSPSRPMDATLTSHGPITPALVFKKPIRPPHSVSPNTNLRNHRKNIRQLLGSPDRTLNIMESPFVTLEPPSYELFTLATNDAYPDLHLDLDSPLPPKTNKSPRRSTKRPRLERANTTAGILADITGDKSNVRLINAPLLSASKLQSPLRLGQSPTKRARISPAKSKLTDELPSLLDSPQFLQQTLYEATATLKATASGDREDYDAFSYALNLPSDESEGGVDILQGFARIGEAAAQRNKPCQASLNEPDEASNHLRPEQFFIAHQSPSRPPKLTRPGLGRSSTTLF